MNRAGTCDFTDLIEDLRDTLSHIDRVRALTPQDPDLFRLREALRERVAALETNEHGDEDTPMAA